ncbi:matrixin family metalloprotease [Nonomuraea diastatica]|uniref:Matrixin family metalloprotease n=1 Tax=Nonomuraea diastatica TaxID=1848329 RepID=A0A4R4WU65_9ACTN|nr:matrixin family metalloprotease [Nonomuraea diastatica]TDD21155.1 matrixin family metalloprotease [Nonomuraea diastatica]
MRYSPRHYRAATGVVVVGLVAAVVPLTATPVSAHRKDYGQKWSNFSYHHVTGYNDQWQQPMTRAPQRWSEHARVALRNASGANCNVKVGRYSSSGYGHYYSYHVNGGSTGCYITLNARTIAAEASRFQNFVHSVFTHELGHALSLGHNERGDSIMCKCRNRNTMTRRQSHDNSDVTDYYTTGYTRKF